jgi:hypothetical protein
MSSRALSGRHRLLSLWLSLLLCASVGACSSVTQLSRRERTVQLRVEAQRPGTAVFRDGALVGHTPTTLTLRYHVVEERRFYRDRLAAVFGALGASAVFAGLGAGSLWLTENELFDFGADRERDESGTTGRISAAGFFVTAATFLGGAVYLLTKLYQRHRRATPTQVTLQLREPGQTALHDAKVDLDTTASPPEPLIFDGRRFWRGSLPPARDAKDALLTMRPQTTRPLTAFARTKRGLERCVGTPTSLRVCPRPSTHSLPHAVLRVLAIDLHRTLSTTPLGGAARGARVELDVRREVRGGCALVFRLRTPKAAHSEPYGTMPSACDEASLQRNARTAARGLRRTLEGAGR